MGQSSYILITIYDKYIISYYTVRNPSSESKQNISAILYTFKYLCLKLYYLFGFRKKNNTLSAKLTVLHMLEHNT